MFIFLFFLLSFSCLSQTLDPNVLLNKVKENFAKIKDYKVEAHIIINVNFLKVPATDATIYFKQPDKVKLESSKFAIIPKEGLNFSPMSFLKGKYTSVFVKNDNLNGVYTSVIKVIPLEENSDIIISTLWIDNFNQIIRKAEVTTRSKGTYTILLDYDLAKTRYALPISMTLLFDIKRNEFHKKFSPDSKENQSKTQENVKGSAVVKYSNYRVNQGLSDSIFEEGNKK